MAPARRAPVKLPMCARRSSAKPSAGVDMPDALTEDEQWRKLELVVELAGEVWK